MSNMKLDMCEYCKNKCPSAAFNEVEETEQCGCFEVNTDTTIELCTFPDSDSNYCKVFRVPREWLVELLEKLDTFHQRKGVVLESFLEEYVWDETWFIYLQAKAESKLINEEEQK